jgi:hypothetical protein
MTIGSSLRMQAGAQTGAVGSKSDGSQLVLLGAREVVYGFNLES